MDDMNALFGQLRALLNERVTTQNLESDPREDTLLALLKRAHQIHPTRYQQEWITYLQSYTERLNFQASTREEFEEIASLTPVEASLTWVVKGSQYTADRSREAFAHVLASPSITRVTHLEFYDVNYGQDALFPLCEADLPQLTQLSFRSCYLREKLINHVVNASWCAHIKTLNIIHMSYLKGGLLSPLLDKEKLSSLVTLRLNNQLQTPQDLHALGHCKLPDTLTHIDMRDSGTDQSCVRRMTKSHHLDAQRTTLDMRGCWLDMDTRRALLNHKLITIDAVFDDSFKGPPAKKAHIEQLARGRHLSHLVGPCHVRGLTINREAANLLMGHHSLKRLDAIHLCFRHTPKAHETLIYDVSTFKSLVENDALIALRSLSLHHFTLDAPCMRMWCDASWLSGLTHLSLKNCELAWTLAELEEFVSHPQFPVLTHLDLSQTKLTDAQLSVWLEHADCGSLQTLTLQQNRIYMKKMTGAELTLPSLERLDLQHNRLGTHGVTFLSHVSMCALKELDLDHNRLKGEGALRLLDAPWCPQLTMLHMDDNDITHEAAAAWLDSEVFEAMSGVKFDALHWTSRSRALDRELQRATKQALSQGQTCRLTTPHEVDPLTYAPREDMITVDVVMTPDGPQVTACVDLSNLGHQYIQIKQQLHTLTHLSAHIKTLHLTGRMGSPQGVHAYLAPHYFPVLDHLITSSAQWFDVLCNTELIGEFRTITMVRPRAQFPLTRLCQERYVALTSLTMMWNKDNESPAFHELIHAPWLSQLETIAISPHINHADHVKLIDLSQHGFKGKVRLAEKEWQHMRGTTHHAHFNMLSGELLEKVPPAPLKHIEEHDEQSDEGLFDISTGKVMRAAKLCEHIEQGLRSPGKGELLEHLHRSGFCYPDAYKLLTHPLISEVDTVRVSTFLSNQERGDIFEGASIMLKPFFLALFNAEGLQSLHTIDMHSSMMGEHDHIAMVKSMLESLLNSRTLGGAEQPLVKNLPLHDSIIAWMLAHQDSLHGVACTFEQLPHIIPNMDTLTSLVDSSLNLDRDMILGIKNS